MAKNIAHGSARKLGFSSPTPSHDAFMLVVCLMAVCNLKARGADIGHAFMHSPLVSGIPVLLKMPLSISAVTGEPVYMLLFKALKRLRDASQAWLNLLSSLIRPLRLLHDAREPCLYTGWLIPPGETDVG